MMTGTIFLKALALWLVILVLAMLNGALREEILTPSIGPTGALVASGIVLSGCVFLVAFAGAPWFGKLAPPAWFHIGLLWLALTLMFEFGFGRFVQDREWPELLEAYTFEDGNLWPLVLVVTLISPALAARSRNLI